MVVTVCQISVMAEHKTDSPVSSVTLFKVEWMCLFLANLGFVTGHRKTKQSNTNPSPHTPVLRYWEGGKECEKKTQGNYDNCSVFKISFIRCIKSSKRGHPLIIFTYLFFYCSYEEMFIDFF